MAAAATNFVLLKPNLKWNRYPIIQQFSMKNSCIPLKIHSNFKALSVKNGFSPCKDLNSKENQFEILAKGFVKPLEGLRKPVAGALFVGFLFFICDPNSVWAASGGRMGGGVSSSRSSSSSSMRISSSTSGGGKIGIFTKIGIAVSVIYIPHMFGEDNKYSVLKLQVGLLGLKSRSLKKDLNCIAETADTSNPMGRRYVLWETIIALLLMYPDHHRIYAHSSVHEEYFSSEGMKRFEEVSAEERGKFDEETLVNINNIKKKKKLTKLMRRSCTGTGNEYIVVTILVCAQGVHNDLLCINNNKDLKEALLKLAAISYSRRILAVEVLWTPQDEDDTLSEGEFLEDYPLLKLVL
ncbi:hypothetical protein ACJIZ3_011570 [Penstemon smallii]|uniref:Uncharacterized protein n=1 Tax=Penstemon smallii TaxID=265156 RepID=A0ABD3UMR5_9LAMI